MLKNVNITFNISVDDTGTTCRARKFRVQMITWL